MRPGFNDFPRLRDLYRQQSAVQGAGVVTFNHGSASFVPVALLHTLPMDQQQAQRMINYAASRCDGSFVVVSGHEILVIAPDRPN